MIVIAASDWHLSDRSIIGIPAVVRILKEAVDLAAQYDKLLIAPGDLTDTPVVGGAVLEAMAEVFSYGRDKGVECLVVPGNHSMDHLNHWLEAHLGKHGLSNVTVSTQPEVLDVSDDVSVVTAPYGTTWAEVQAVISKLTDVKKWNTPRDGKRQYLLVAHDEVMGCDYGNGHKASGGYRVEDLAASPFAFLAFGHIHKSQSIDLGSPYRQAFYCGALAQYRLDAAAQPRGYATLNTETHNLRHINCVGGEHPEFLRWSWKLWQQYKYDFDQNKRVWLELTLDPDDPSDAEVEKSVAHAHLQRLYLRRRDVEQPVVKRSEIKMTDDLRTMAKKIADAKIPDDKDRAAALGVFDKYARRIGK